MLDLPGLLARARSHGLDVHAAKRPAFHELIAVRRGTLRCSLDFSAHDLRAGDWLWVRPGQVHQYDSDLSAAEGTIVLFTPGFLTPATVEAARVDQPVWRAPLTPAAADAAALRGVLDLLEAEYRRLTGLPLQVHIDVVRHLLSVLVLRLTHAQGRSGPRAAAARRSAASSGPSSATSRAPTGWRTTHRPSATACAP
ncbi:cupin domain-containing protein [Streptomyces mexicanus]